MPKVSIIMSVYNGMPYLKEAIFSILNQTFKDFEFIIINDGSTDESEKFLKELTDPRIKLISRENRGLIASLNQALELSQGELVARMDADDISEPTRLEKQVELFDSNPQIAICGSWAKAINENGEVLGKYDYPPKNNLAIKFYSLFHNPFIHPSVMFRKKIVPQNAYSKKFKNIEDYELWSRLLRNNQAINLPEELLNYRILKTSITRSKNLEIRLKGMLVRLLIILRVFLKLPI